MWLLSRTEALIELVILSDNSKYNGNALAVEDGGAVVLHGRNERVAGQRGVHNLHEICQSEIAIGREAWCCLDLAELF